MFEEHQLGDTFYQSVDVDVDLDLVMWLLRTYATGGMYADTTAGMAGAFVVGLLNAFGGNEANCAACPLRTDAADTWPSTYFALLHGWGGVWSSWVCLEEFPGTALGNVPAHCTAGTST